MHEGPKSNHNFDHDDIISGVGAEWQAKDPERAGCLYRAGPAKNYFGWRERGGKSTLVHIVIWKLPRTGRRFQEKIPGSADRTNFSTRSWFAARKKNLNCHFDRREKSFSPGTGRISW